MDRDDSTVTGSLAFTVAEGEVLSRALRRYLWELESVAEDRRRPGEIVVVSRLLGHLLATEKTGVN